MNWAVLDTNVLISGFMNETGTPGRILDAALDGAFLLATSPILLAEFEEKITSKKLARYFDDPMSLIMLVRSIAAVVFPVGDVRIAHDPDDDHLLSAAMESHADYIVTGDKRSGLLELGTFEGSTILTPKAFLSVLEGSIDP